jgi:hypothetical protein
MYKIKNKLVSLRINGETYNAVFRLQPGYYGHKPFNQLVTALLDIFDDNDKNAIKDLKTYYPDIFKNDYIYGKRLSDGSYQLSLF